MPLLTHTTIKRQGRNSTAKEISETNNVNV
jgi:hypothetical protein